jgi:hypothetical protein
MPRKSEWIQKISDIIENLEGIPAATMLDRAKVQQLFEVSPRQANRILHRLGAESAGGALLLRLETCREHLEQLRKDAHFVFESRRRQRLHDILEQARKEARARRIPIAVTAPAPSSLSGLPQEIRLLPGRLEVHYNAPTELLERLMLLATAIAEDWDRFSRTHSSFGAERGTSGSA